MPTNPTEREGLRERIAGEVMTAFPGPPPKPVMGQEPRQRKAALLAADRILALLGAAPSGEPDEYAKLVWLMDGAGMEYHDGGADWVIRIPLRNPADEDETVWDSLALAMETSR